MSDLISRSELLKMLRSSKVKQEDSFGNTRQLIAMDIDKLIKYVENMPDAYNVEKVAECIDYGGVCEGNRQCSSCDLIVCPVDFIEREKAVKIITQGGDEQCQ